MEPWLFFPGLKELGIRDASDSVVLPPDCAECSLEAARVPFKAHWGKINFIDPAFVQRNHRLDEFAPLIAPMFMNDHLAERIGSS